MKKKHIFAAAIVVVFLTLIAFAIYITESSWWKESKKRPQERYDELEFIVLHRPHVTYFVDMKYFLCFATRKPDYQDLVQFVCPERMWKDIEGSLQASSLK